MLELTGWGDIIRGVGILYWLIGAYLVYLSIKNSSTRFRKIGNGLLVAFLFGFLPIKSCVDQVSYARAQKVRLAKAEAIFDEKCKSTGEKIYRIVEDVEGIYLARLRTGYNNSEQGADDPYGNEGDYGHSDAYILSFLEGRSSEHNGLDDRSRKKMGYRYVDAEDPSSGQRYRYTGVWWKDPKWNEDRAPELRLDRTPTSQPAPRYGVTYEDLTTPEERALWIAGSVLRIVDLQTNEILAERIGYMMDRGQGADIQTRQAWSYAARNWSCPRPALARNFVEKVLKIREQ